MHSLTMHQAFFKLPFVFPTILALKMPFEMLFTIQPVAFISTPVFIELDAKTLSKLFDA